MIRVRVFSLMLVAVAFAADSVNPQEVEYFTKITQALKLNQDEVKLATQGEDVSHYQLAHALVLEKSQNKFSCKSIKVDPSEIKFTFYSMPSYNIVWNGSQNINLNPNFDPKLPTQILISGRMQSEDVFQPAKLAYTYGVRERRMNIISVNWDRYSSCLYPISVAFTVPQLAIVVSNMIQNTLVIQNNMNFDKLRLIGFGFGAHIAGIAAKNLQKKTARITALDPAGFLYNIVPSHLKLQKGDAKFIDTIMTNQGFLGMTELVGDVNFLPSGGHMQKACENFTLFHSWVCSHNLAIEYFIESVQKGVSGFVAKPANSWAEFLAQNSFIKYSEIMGEDVSQKKTGNFYLEVNAQAPYSRGVNGAYLFKKGIEEPTEKREYDFQPTQNEEE